MFGLVARLVHQKGIDLVLSAADEIVEAGGQIVVTGSGEPAIEQALMDAHRRRPDAIGVAIGFNDAQARRIFAGSDFTLMPSRFEPCGLSQMYAQRFGSLPIGHQTGGLAETITDGETGFLFSQPSPSRSSAACAAPSSTFMTTDRLNHAPQRHGALVQLGPFGRPATARCIGSWRRCEGRGCSTSSVIASAAKQSRSASTAGSLDCFVARAPRNDGGCGTSGATHPFPRTIHLRPADPGAVETAGHPVGLRLAAEPGLRFLIGADVAQPVRQFRIDAPYPSQRIVRGSACRAHQAQTQSLRAGAPATGSP